MNDEAARGAHLGSLLEFVSPAAIVGHRNAAKRVGIELAGILGIGHRRVVHQDHEDLPANVHAFEIVPLKLGSLHAVAHKNHVRIGGTGLHHAFRPSHEIALKFRRE